jgi:hypothetical protein
VGATKNRVSPEASTRAHVSRLGPMARPPCRRTSCARVRWSGVEGKKDPYTVKHLTLATYSPSARKTGGAQLSLPQFPELRIRRALVNRCVRLCATHRARASNRHEQQRARPALLPRSVGPDGGSRTRSEPVSRTRGMGVVQAEQTMAKASQGGPLGSLGLVFGSSGLWPLVFDPTQPVFDTHTWPSACPRG